MLGVYSAGLVGRVVTNIETVKLCHTGLTKEQLTGICTEICNSDSLTLKGLDLSGN